MADSKKKKAISNSCPQTAAMVKKNSLKKIPQNLIVNQKSKINKNISLGKKKLPGIKKNSQPKAPQSKGSPKPNSKPVSEEIEKEIEPNPVGIKEMVEQASVEQRAITMIDDTLYLFNNKGEGNSSGVEKYELINKEEFEKMKNDIEEYRKKALELKDEYTKKKEEYEKITNELNNHNYKYYNTEKAKTDSITKLFSMELKLKQMIVNNSKLQNEIQKEIDGKNNIFRALNEFKRKYDKNIHPELKDIFLKIKDEQFNPINGVPKSNKIGFLEEKLQSLKIELENKEKRIETLKKAIADNNSNN